ncbi:MAG: type II secretion system F family protein [Phycisphaerales bacterium]|nr:MAG: type II secretion system F family protein [Phycisphaerales bacterium]
MASFEYTARDGAGHEFTGTYRDIGGVAVLRSELHKVGYVLVRARQIGKRSGRNKPVREQDIVAFAYKFSGMYSAGLSVIGCLETLEDQTGRSGLRAVLADVRRRVEVGSSLAKAFEPHQDIFSGFFVGMLEAGEAAGRLAEALEMSAIYLDKRACLRGKIRSAFVYPIAVGVVCLGVLSCLLLFVVPIFSRMYGSLHVALPWPTQLLVTASGMFQGWGWLVLGGLAAAIVALKKVMSGPAMRNRWNRFKLRMPVLGELNRLILISRFVRPFALLISVGVSVIEALRVAGNIAQNEEMREISREMRKTAQSGNPVGTALAAHPIFPPVIVQMAVSGEQVGRLAEMLAKGVDLVDRDIEKMIAGLVVKLEPILTVIMGLLVGLVLLGVYLPMFDYMTHLK